MPEIIVQNCVKNPSLILKPRKTSSTKDSSTSQSTSSTSSASVAHESPATDAGASSSDYKRARPSSNQDFRSNSNPSRAKIKGSSSSTPYRKGQR